MRHFLIGLFCLGMLGACHDADDDDYRRKFDCNDEDAKMNPGEKEVCDGIDNDCNGEIDDGAKDAVTWYADHDGDGFGALTVTFVSCAAPPDFVEDSTDCDDNNGEAYPDAEEICDGVDNNCDDSIDEGLPETFHPDVDEDGFGDPDVSWTGCEAPPGWLLDDTDCDDADDGANPGATEVCDEVDNNCDGAVDEGLTTTFYADSDGDGFGNDGSPWVGCEAPPGFVTDNTDCDDTNIDADPANVEVCDGVDNNCDGLIDDGVTTTYYPDNDGDGFGNPAQSTDACDPPPGWVPDNTDCDDDQAGNFPGNAETCDGLDNDCDGAPDNGVLNTFYADLDGDGFGNAATSFEACQAPPGFVADNTDCDDASAANWPGNVEVCDELDNDCDAVVDNGVLNTYYGDADGDGFGNLGSPFVACSPPAGFVITSTDCNDGNFDTWPGAPDLCDGEDNDCDGVLDNSGVDSDADGIDNCNDPTVYYEDFSACPGDSNQWGPMSWGVDEFADMACCNDPGNDPLGMPFPGVPIDGEDWDWCGTLDSGTGEGHSVAWGPDHGQLNVFTVLADMGADANADAVGVVFDYKGPGDFFLVRWDDPRDDYWRSTKLELIRCIDTVCAQLDVVDPIFQAGNGFNLVEIEVRYDQIDVYLNGIPELSTITNGGDAGPGRIGAYAFSADNGADFDFMQITQP